MSGFQLDTSGKITFAQGYVRAALEAAGEIVPRWNAYEERTELECAAFSDLSPEALALILKDCATFARMYGGEPQTRENGARFWKLRQEGWPGVDFAPAFPPIRLHLRDGKVYATTGGEGPMSGLGPKCAAFGCWNYTAHRSGLCLSCRAKKQPALATPTKDQPHVG